MTRSYNNHQEFRSRLDKLKESVDPRYLIESLNFNITRETAGEIRAACKIHGGDNETAFRFNKETMTWICFSHHCEDIFGRDVIGLIKGVLNVDFVLAVKYLENLVGDIDSLDYVEYRRKNERESFIKSKRSNRPRSSIVNEECLKQFKFFRSDYFLGKGFSEETLKYFELAGGHIDSEGITRDIIPIRDDDGLLVAYSLRDVRENVTYDKKYILTTHFNKDKVLYNLNNAKNYLEKKILIVVEGFKAVWKLWECGIKNTVAVMGTKLTQGQECLLYKHAVDTIVIFFDGDVAGVYGATNICTNLSGKINAVPIFITEEGKDPADLNRQTICEYLEGYF